MKIKQFCTAHKKLLIVVALVLAVAIGLGAWYVLANQNREPVYVYPFHYIGMTEYWGDSQESYGPVSTDKIQTVFLSETQEVTEIAVKEGDTVKKGDLLLTFDTTLSDLQLERKRLDVEKLKLQLQKAQSDLVKINNMVPLESIDMGGDEFYVDESLGPMIDSCGYEIPENPEYDGSSEYKPLILWLSQNQSLNGTIIGQLQVVAEYLQTMNSQTVLEDGSYILNPVEAGSLYVVVRITENDQQFASKTTWQGLYINTADYSFRFFAPMVSDPMAADEGWYEEPTVDYSSYYTAAQIAQMRSETQKKIKDLEFQVKMADAEYQIMLTEVSDGNVYADIDGEVVSVLSAEEAKSTRQPVVKVSGGGGFYVEGVINELEKEKLPIGLEVTVNDWNTGATYTGTVSSLGDFPKQDRGYGSGNPNSSYYPFMVYIDGSADLQAGSYVSVTYSTSQEEQGIYLENPFLRTENGKTYVLVLGADGKLEQRFVTTGKSLWGNYTEIRSGLTPEDLIAFPYGKGIKPGIPAVEGDMSNLYG